jgi:predicted AAA+ superfamily ATPase
VVIDEVQKVPALLDMVHSLIEQHAGWRFVLTGSSARKLKRAGVDLLAGRALLTTMHPFLAAELGERFDLAAALETGLLPVVLASPAPERVLSTYVDLYVREEVQMEGLVRNIGGFNRFLEAVSFSHAQVLNVSRVSRECEVERKVVANYVSILEDLLLAHRLPVFRKRAKRKTAVHQKLYLFDVGVFRSLRPSGPLDRPEEIQGGVLEGLVFQHLRAWNDYRHRPNRIFYWRTHHGTEVDFVVYGDDGLWGLEVKNTKTVRPADLRGLEAFAKPYPEARRCLLYRGTERFERKSILCLPVESLLERLHPARSLQEAVLG